MGEPEGVEYRPLRWTTEYFYNRFDEVLKDNPDMPYPFVYGKVEQEHIDLFNHARFSSYDSFRNCRKKWLFEPK